MTLARIVGLLSLVSLPLTTTSCTASLELDRFKKAAVAAPLDTTTISYFDLRFTAKGMLSHINEFLELRIVDKDNSVQAKAIYTNISGPDFSLYLRKLIPKANGPYRLDFWADHNNSARYDGIEGGINDKDHAWRRILSDPLPEDVRFGESRYELSFIHDTQFVDIFTDLLGNKISGADTLLPLNLKMGGLGAYVDKMIEIRVIDKASGRLVALHRNGRAKEAYVAQVAGVLDEETPYELSIYVDLNGDGKLSPGDPAWKTEFVSSDKGIDQELNVGLLEQSPIETGEPL
jgi:hypothetical protein